MPDIDTPAARRDKIAGVTLDDWKIPVFKRHLDTAATPTMSRCSSPPDISILKVHYRFVHELQPIIEAANAECARQRRAGG